MLRSYSVLNFYHAEIRFDFLLCRKSGCFFFSPAPFGR